jgi:hypothetical protein
MIYLPQKLKKYMHTKPTRLVQGTSIIKWTKPNSFVLFKRARTWNWKLKWHTTIAQNLWFNHIFELYNIIKFSFFDFYNLFLFLSKSYWKENCKNWVLQFIYISIRMTSKTMQNLIIIQSPWIWFFFKKI